MKIKNPYQPRPIRFLEVIEHNNWLIKLYSIAIKNEKVSTTNIEKIKPLLDTWLLKSKLHKLDTYNIATLILHEGKEGCFAIINWWIDENMLQNFVYLLKEDSDQYKLFSQNGIITCVWEMAVLWHERNAWVKHVLQQHNNPNIKGYLQDQLNTDI